MRIPNKHHWACLFFSPGESRESLLLPFTILYCQGSFSTWHQLLMDFLVSSSKQPIQAHPPAIHWVGVNCVSGLPSDCCYHLCLIHYKHYFLTVFPPDECGMFTFHARSSLWEGGRQSSHNGVEEGVFKLLRIGLEPWFDC